MTERVVRGCESPDCLHCNPQPGGEVYRQQVSSAGLDLALWSRSWAESVRWEDVCALVVAELANLYLDRNVSEGECVAAVQFAYRSVKAARETLGVAVHPCGEGERQRGSEATGQRSGDESGGGVSIGNGQGSERRAR